MSLAIVVDSVADMSFDECERYGLVAVPLTVEVGGERFKDQYEISSDEFYERMAASDDLPKSSQPAPTDFIETYNKLAEEGSDNIIALHLAAVLSGTVESSGLAASQVAIPVEVVDTFNACAGQGLLAILASDLRAAGLPDEEVIERVKAARGQTHFFIACGTLENLLKNGRLSASEVEGANLLNIKPMITCDEQGILRNIDKAKGMNGVIKKYVEKLQQLTEEEGIQRVRFCHTHNEKGVAKLKRSLEEAGVEFIDCGTCLCGAIVATHLGMEALGFGSMPDSLAHV